MCSSSPSPPIQCRIKALLPLSHRYPWTAKPNRLAEALHQLEAQGRSLIDLSNSNPTRARLDLPDPFQIHSLQSDNYTPAASGSLAARTAVATYYQQEFAANIAPERILLTTSTSEAYSYCFKLIADPGASILIPQPSYPLLQFLIEAEGLQAKPYLLHQAGGEWILDRDQLAASCDTTTRAIILVHPNNPTGHFLCQDDLEWLVEFSRDRFWLISDEVFACYNWSASKDQPRSLSALQPENALVLSGLSKICALPQMKLGWIVMPTDTNVHHHLELVADTYLSVSAPIQRAAQDWLPNRAKFQAPVRTRCLENLELIRQALNGSSWAMLPVEAGWTVILRGPAHCNEEDFVLRLLEHGFSAHPGYYYDLPFHPCLVLSLLTPTSQLQAGLAALIAS